MALEVRLRSESGCNTNPRSVSRLILLLQVLSVKITNNHKISKYVSYTGWTRTGVRSRWRARGRSVARILTNDNARFNSWVTAYTSKSSLYL